MSKFDKIRLLDKSLMSAFKELNDIQAVLNLMKI